MKTIKHLSVALAMALGMSTLAQTTTNDYTFNPDTAIPVDSQFGVTLSQDLTVPGGSISDVTVGLDISGGFNGDLYAYLSGPNGGFAVLLNRVGVQSGNSFGYSDSGMDVTFADSAADSIHFYQNVPGYDITSGTASWQPDGENINPNSPASDYPVAQSAMLSSFEDTNPNGTWTLFLADLSSGSPSTVVSWSLDIVTVPEPSAWALMGIGAAALLWIQRRQNSSGSL